MLGNVKKMMTITGRSIIDEIVVEEYQATIRSENPEDINITCWKRDKALYKDNRSQCRKDAEKFEDMVYELQNKMIAAQTEKEG